MGWEAEFRSNADNRMYRANFGYNALRMTLADHTRGEDSDEPRLPKETFTFGTMTTPPVA